MAKKTDVRDSTTRPQLYVIALLRVHIVKKQHMYFSLYSLFSLFHIVLKTLLFPVVTRNEDL